MKPKNLKQLWGRSRRFISRLAGLSALFFLLLLVLNFLYFRAREYPAARGGDEANSKRNLRYPQDTPQPAVGRFPFPDFKPAILGSSSELTEAEKIKTEIIHWQEIINLQPDFRDAYLKLAILNWQLSRDFDARKFLDKALEIDPNNEAAKKISELFK